jgi:hypothetical protein
MATLSVVHTVRRDSRSSVTERGLSFASSWQRQLRERATLRYVYTCYVFDMESDIHLAQLDKSFTDSTLISQTV